MRFGISEHLAGSPGFYYTNKGCDTEGKYKGIPYDGSNPAYAELYYYRYRFPRHLVFTK